MKYNEREFAKSANKKATLMWVVMSAVLSAAYAIEIVKGLKTVQYFIIMEICCWLPILIGLVVLKTRGWHAHCYRDICASGYWIFYAYIMFTSPGTLAFAYVLPLLCMLVIYKDRNLMLRYGVAHMIILIITIIRNYNNDISLKEEYPNISLGTVYRNLNLLADLGEAIKITTPNGGDRFDGRIAPHYHFCCTSCGKVEDLILDELTFVNEEAGKNFDGVIESHAMMFYGKCKDCVTAN